MIGRRALVLLCGASLGFGCLNFDQAFEDCKTQGLCLEDGGMIPGGAVTITLASMAAGYANQTFGVPLTASGGDGTFSWSITSGTLPAGLSLASDGMLSGTPTETGTFQFTVTVSSGGHTADKVFDLTILADLQITTATLTDGYTGNSYMQTLAATGGAPPYVFAFQGTPPPGLSLSATGTLSGVPAFPGATTVTLAVRDVNNHVSTKPMSFTVYQVPLITTSSLPDAYTDQPYNALIGVTEGKAPITFSVTAGSLPTGLALNAATGALTGTAASAAGYTFTVTATDVNMKPSASVVMSMTVYDPVDFLSPTALPDAYTGTNYTYTFQKVGGKFPVIITASSGTPPGVGLTASTGQFFGTPTTANTYSFTATATDAHSRQTTEPFTIVVYDPPDITTTALGDGTIIEPYSSQLVATGGKAPLTWTETSSLPPGLSLASNGLVTGTPTVVAPGSFSVKVTDATGRFDTATVTLNVYGTLTITSSTLANAYSGGVVYNAALIAAGGHGPYTWQFVSGTLPAPLTVNPLGSITGTPGAPGFANFRVQVTDSTTPTPVSVQQDLTFTIVAPPSITTTTIDDGYKGQPYAVGVQAVDGKPPYLFTIAPGPALPNGLALDANTGQITGTPLTAIASTTVTVQVRDQNNLIDTQPFTFGVFDMPDILTTSMADGYVGISYSQNIVSSGGKAPLTWSLINPPIPNGLTVNADGSITGTPTAVQTTSPTVRVSDVNGRVATKAITLQTYLVPTITNTLADGYVGAVYPSTTLNVNGGKAPYTFSNTSGAPPTGITFNAGPPGTLTGTPSASGTANFTITVTDNNARANPQPMSLPVFDQPSVSTTTLPEAYSGSPYTASLTGTGGKSPIGWSVSVGPLPAGLTLNSNGSFSGSTTAVGASGFTVQMSDANSHTATKALSLTVLNPLQVTTPSLGDGYLGSPYSTTSLAASGGHAPYTFSFVGSLPSGVTLSSAGVFGGTPNGAAGPVTFDAKVTDFNGVSATRTLTITIYSPPSVNGPATLADAYQGSPYSGAVTGSDGKPPYTFDLSVGTTPAGLTLNGGGSITGTPTGTGLSTFTVRLTDANGTTATLPMNLTSLSPLAVATSALDDGYVGSAYSMPLAGSGGEAPYSFSLAAGTWPSGLGLSAGAVVGTPNGVPGTSTVTVRVTDGNGVTATRVLDLIVRTPPSVTTTTLPDGYVGTAYSAPTLAGTNGKAPYTFTVGAGMPNSVSLALPGTFSGTPTVANTFTFTVTLHDANGKTATADLTIIVRPTLVVTGLPLPDGYLTEPYVGGGVAGSGGLPGYTFSISSGSIPAGMSFDGNTGAFSGTPTVSGTASFTVRVTDANAAIGSSATTIEVFALPAITTASLATAALGSPYNQPVAVSGGKAPFTWGQTGALPSGITFSGGTFSGSTGVTGTFPGIQVTATDANGRQAQHTYTLSVVNTVVVTTVSIADGYLTTPVNQTLTAAGGVGGPYTFLIDGGTLTTGVSVASGGLMSGTPSAPGSYSFVVQAADVGLNLGYKGFTQDVYSLPTVSTVALVDAYTDQSYSATLVGSGGKSPYTWSIIDGGIPSGVALTVGTGALSGQAASPGTSNFTVQLSDVNTKLATRSLSIVAYNPPLQTSPATLTDGYLTASYGPLPLGVSGGKATFTWSGDGGVPSGLTLPASGVISGTPDGGAGAFTFGTTVTDANGRTSSLSHTINIHSLPSITTAATLADAYRQVSYSAPLNVSGGVGPFDWQVTSGALPTGITLNPSSGLVSGTATQSGTFTPTITVSDANGKLSNKTFSLTVAQPLQITTATLPDGYVAQAYPSSVSASGGKPGYSFLVTSGGLPGGIGLNPSSGAFTGTPSGVGFFSFVVTVTDSNGTTATQPLSITTFTMPVLQPGVLPDAYVTEGYNQSLVATGGKTPYDFQVTTGTLPTGLFLGQTTGVISGNPTGATQTFTVTLKDANNVPSPQSFTISIYSLPSVGTTSLPDAYGSQPYSQPLTANGGKSPFTWTVNGGSLPSGLGINAGIIGTTVGASVGNNQNWIFTVNVQDANGRNATGALQIVTFQLPQITNGPLTTATEGVTYMKAPGVFETVNAINGKPPYTFSGTSLPPGLTVQSNGNITGTPAQLSAAGYSPSLQVTDSNTRSGFASPSLQVVTPSPILGGGTNGSAPTGGPITDTLTVFVIDRSGNGMTPVGVRVRKTAGGGTEYMPQKELLTNAAGKVVFTGLGLNGTTDTVDITANGPPMVTMTLGGVNASVITLEAQPSDSPSARSGGSGVYDPSIQRLIYTMGFSTNGSASAFHQAGCRNDLVRLTSPSTTATWSRDIVPGMSTSPQGRVDAAMAVSNTNVVYLFGGSSCKGPALSDLWKYVSNVGGGGTWTQLFPTNTGPSARNGAAMGPDPSGGGRIVMFGGLTATGIPSNELWRYDPVANAWTLLGGVPGFVTGRFGMGSTYNAATNENWFCGGLLTGFGNAMASDCYAVNGANPPVWTTKGSFITSRSRFAMAADTTGRVYAFGGRTQSGTTSELLSTTGGAWTTVLINGPYIPEQRERAVAYWDTVLLGGKLVIAGGNRSFDEYGMPDVNVFDPGPGTWTQTSAGFAPESGHELTGSITWPSINNADVIIRASSNSGWEGEGHTQISGGSGTYTIRGIPHGDMITLNAYVIDGSLSFPASLASGRDEGLLGPINANTTQNLTFPLSVAHQTYTGSVALPMGWTTAQLMIEPSQSRTNYPFLRNSNGQGEQTAGPGLNWRMDTIPPIAPAQQDGFVAAMSSTPSYCEFSGHALANMSVGAQGLVSLVIPPRNLAPGFNECTPWGSANQLDLGSVYFQPPTANGPVATAVADLNGDGNPDAVVANSNSTNIGVYFGQGDGTFGSNNWYTFTTTAPPQTLMLGKVGNHTNWDLIVAVRAAGNASVQVFFGDGAGNFALSATYPLPGNADPQSIAMGDLDNNGAADIVTANGTPNDGITYLSGAANGTFVNAGTSTTCIGPRSVVIADIDMDGTKDLAWSCEGNGAPYDNKIRVKHGTGVVPPPVGGTNDFNTVGTRPWKLVLADLSGDGKPDLASISRTSGQTTVLRNQSNGGNAAFATPLGYGTAVDPQGLALGDVDNDGDIDLVVSNTGGNQVSVLRNNGFSLFAQGPVLTTPSSPLSAAVADLNGDARLDAVVPCFGSNQLQALLQARLLQTQSDATYTFNFPAGSGAFQVVRGPELQGQDWTFLGALSALQTSVSLQLPLPSTLAPPIPTAPSGQIVGWAAQMYKGAFDVNNARFKLVRANDQMQSGASLYIRP